MQVQSHIKIYANVEFNPVWKMNFFPESARMSEFLSAVAGTSRAEVSELPTAQTPAHIPH